jgi:hypothetical protein
MKIQFQYQNPIHHFTLTETLESSDLDVLRTSFHQLYESNPPYLVVDVSQLETGLQNAKLESLLKEITALAQSKCLDFFIARTQLEADTAFALVLEVALDKKTRILKGKQQIHNEMRTVATQLLQENERLKSVLQSEHDLLATNSPPTGKMSSLLDRFWNESNLRSKN